MKAKWVLSVLHACREVKKPQPLKYISTFTVILSIHLKFWLVRNGHNVTTTTTTTTKNELIICPSRHFLSTLSHFKSPKSQILCYQTHLHCSQRLCVFLQIGSGYGGQWRWTPLLTVTPPVEWDFSLGRAWWTLWLQGYLSSPTVTSIVVVPQSRTGVWAQLERWISWLVTQLELGLGYWDLWSLKADSIFVDTGKLLCRSRGAEEQRSRAHPPVTQAHVHTVSPAIHSQKVLNIHLEPALTNFASNQERTAWNILIAKGRHDCDVHE